ncbi:hypothetical protein cypCar_00036799, partial [Cyprinus carpio]
NKIHSVLTDIFKYHKNSSLFYSLSSGVNGTLNETVTNFTNELVLVNGSQSSNIQSTKYPGIFQSGPEEEENEPEEREMDRNSERGSIVEREEEEAVEYEDATAVLMTEEPGRDKQEEEIPTTHNAMEWSTNSEHFLY